MVENVNITKRIYDKGDFSFSLRDTLRIVLHLIPSEY